MTVDNELVEQLTAGIKYVEINIRYDIEKQKKLFDCPKGYNDTDDDVKYVNWTGESKYFKTGEISNITVFDFDVAEVYENLLKEHPEIAKHFTVRTKKGYHVYFKYTPLYKTTIDCCDDPNYTKIDLLNGKHMVIAPNSRYKIGKETVTYSYLGGEILEIPEVFTLLPFKQKVINKKVLKDKERVENEDTRAKRALEKEEERAKKALEKEVENAFKSRNEALISNVESPVDVYSEANFNGFEIIENMYNEGYLEDFMNSEECNWEIWSNFGFCIHNYVELEIVTSDTAYTLFDNISKLCVSKYDRQYTANFWNSITIGERDKTTLLTYKYIKKIIQKFNSTVNEGDLLSKVKLYSLCIKRKTPLGIVYHPTKLACDYINHWVCFLKSQTKYICVNKYKSTHYQYLTIKELVENYKNISNTITEWTYSDYRLNYEKEDVYINFDEQDNITINENEYNRNIFNHYRRPQYVIDPNYDFTKSLLYKLLKESVCTNARLSFDANLLEFIVTKYIPYMIKYGRSNICLSFQGDYGTFKSCTASTVIGTLLGLDYVYSTSDIEELTAHFNAHTDAKVLYIIEESQTNTNEYHKFQQVLKDLITSETRNSTAKFCKTKTIRNNANFIFITNNNTPLYIERGNRRHIPIEFSNIHRQDTKFYSEVKKELDADIEKMRGWFIQQLPERISLEQLRPVTELENMNIELHTNPFEVFCSECIDEYIKDGLSKTEIVQRFNNWCIDQGFKTETKRVSVTYFTQCVYKLGYISKRVTINGERKYTYKKQEI